MINPAGGHSHPRGATPIGAFPDPRKILTGLNRTTKWVIAEPAAGLWRRRRFPLGTRRSEAVGSARPARPAGNGAWGGGPGEEGRWRTAPSPVRHSRRAAQGGGLVASPAPQGLAQGPRSLPTSHPPARTPALFFWNLEKQGILWASFQRDVPPPNS